MTAGSRKAANDLFSDEVESEIGEITAVAELPGITDTLVDILKKNNIIMIEDLLVLDEEALSGLEGMNKDNLNLLEKLLKDSLEVVDESSDSDKVEDNQENPDSTQEESAVAEEYECPECGAPITIDMTTCPNCGIGLSFEYEDEE